MSTTQERAERGEHGGRVDLGMPQVPRPTERNLLDNRWIAGLLRSRWYPAVFQVPVAAVFGLVAYQLVSGPATAHDNAGTALMWVLWWPLVPITFLLATDVNGHSTAAEQGIDVVRGDGQRCNGM